MMTRRVVFHIGLEKTGTTAFQRYCAANRLLLERSGVLYPRYRARRRASHAALAASYLGEGRADPSVVPFPPRRERAVAALRQEMDRSGAACMLISAEHLSSRFDERRVDTLARDFGGYDASIIVAVRDLHARFASAYGTAIESGGRLTLDAYADEVLHPANPYLDIAATLRPWRKTFGAARIKVIDYDAEPDIVPALLRLCGRFDCPATQPRPLQREKVSLAPDALRVLRLCNVLLHDRQGAPSGQSFPVWAQHTLFSALCRRALARSALPVRSTPWTVTTRTMERLDRIAARERRWLRDHYGVILQGDGARARLVVGAETPPSERDVAAAEALVDQVVGPLWSASAAIAAAARTASRLRR